MIARRPAVEAREVIEEGDLDPVLGLVGDNWHLRGSSRTDDGGPHPLMQVNIMNARVAHLVAGDRGRWSLAGDQLYVDLDLSEDNMPPGARLQIGDAVLEVTTEPHTGCGKFVRRFGVDAMKFVNSPEGRRRHLRGINARVVSPGRIRTGDRVRRLSPAGGAALSRVQAGTLEDMESMENGSTTSTSSKVQTGQGRDPKPRARAGVRGL
jgi:hypothetical protein